MPAMNRMLSIALLIVGCVLIIYGISASDSFSSDVSRFFTGNPTDRAMWLLIGGAVAAIVGIGGMLRGGTPRNH
jgi:amino acid permease